MTPLTQNYEHLAATVIKGLEKRQMEGYYCPDSSSAVAKALELMPQGSSIAWGGSMTLAQVGLMEAIRAGFDECWKTRDFKTIVAVGERLPEAVLQEDPALLMYYDNACGRV